MKEYTIKLKNDVADVYNCIAQGCNFSVEEVLCCGLELTAKLMNPEETQGEENYAELKEILYLLSIPGIKQKLHELLCQEEKKHF